MPIAIDNINHMLLGIVSEYFEAEEAYFRSVKNADAVSIEESIGLLADYEKELGDILWYLAGLCHFANLKFEVDNDPDNKNVTKAIETLCSEFKAHWVYNRDLETVNHKGYVPLDHIQKAVYGIINWVISQPFKIENVMQMNIDKLAARYPEQYTDYLANNRNNE